MLILQNLTYIHPGKELLFDNINLTINSREKIALVGNNGIGKSTLLKIIAGELQASGGQITRGSGILYVPQIFGQFNHLSVAEALGIEQKIKALKAILNGNVSEENMATLDDDWTVEERCSEALKYWQLSDLQLSQKLATLSGGQKTKVFLTGISIHQPDLILLDEPSNHLDYAARDLLYEFIQSTTSAVIVVSHDRKLLNLFPNVAELTRHGINMYGGNYDFYAGQKQIEREALSSNIQDKEKALRKAKEKERETMERQQRLDSRGRKKQEKAGVARIMMKTLKNSAEQSTSRMKDVHVEKIEGISGELQELRSFLPAKEKMRFWFNDALLHKGKILVKAQSINFQYDHKMLWKKNLDFQIVSGERIALKGLNGSGKTTLINIILGNLEPVTGSLFRADNKSVYIDQEYSLVDNNKTVYGQAAAFNSAGLEEHEIKIRLSRFLFTKDDWGKSCSILSGGEKMRLLLCCLTIGNQAPDMIILDEPTNNLDIQNVEMLTSVMKEYTGTLIVISHDQYFLDGIGVYSIPRYDGGIRELVLF
jgi:ATPase subunit of ABC transporter with duplicated ATPase domains